MFEIWFCQSCIWVLKYGVPLSCILIFTEPYYIISCMLIKASNGRSTKFGSLKCWPYWEISSVILNLHKLFYTLWNFLADISFPRPLTSGKHQGFFSLMLQPIFEIKQNLVSASSFTSDFGRTAIPKLSLCHGSTSL